MEALAAAWDILWIILLWCFWGLAIYGAACIVFASAVGITRGTRTALKRSRKTHDKP